MRASVPGGLYEAQVVVSPQEVPVAPALGAELHHAEERSERDDLAERPQRHVVSVLPHNVVAVRAARATVELAFDVGSLALGDRCEVVPHYLIAVLAGVLCGREQAHLGEVVHVERHGQQQVPQHAVGVRQQPELAEVEVDVLPVTLAPDVLFEVLAVGVDAEEPVLGAQMRLGIGL